VRFMRIAAVILFLSATLGVSAQGLANRRAPSFSLPDSTLAQHDILDYRGNWLLINFIKTESCPACEQLSMKLEGAKKKYGAKVQILSIVVTPPETQATVGKYAATTKMTSSIVFDLGQVTASYFKATPQSPGFDTPHLFAINPAGTIARDWSQAAANSPTFLAELDKLIAAPPAKK
jgi:peroxiredoxin